MENFLKIYLPLYLVLYMFIAFVLPTYRTFKQTGINPITFGKEDTAHNYIGFVMKLLILLLFINIYVYAFSIHIYKYFVPINYLENIILIYIGLVLIHVALVWLSIAQFQMRNSWRIGIDELNKTELKTKGIFGVSRNPIFWGMILSLLGIFLIIPNCLSFFLMLSTYFIIQIQIRLEEAFLEKQHGATYLAYKQKVPRLLF